MISKIFDPKILKVIGIYVILILAVVRFVVYPLGDAVAKKKMIYHELQEACEFKERQFARRALEQQTSSKTVADKEAVAPYLYEKDMPFSSMQADFLENVIKVIEKKGLVVQSFEMLAPAAGKTISEVPVLLRASGKAQPVLDTLMSFASEGKITQIKGLEINKSGAELSLVLTLSAFRMEK